MHLQNLVSVILSIQDIAYLMKYPSWEVPVVFHLMFTMHGSKLDTDI